jgi:hypothetical protein
MMERKIISVSEKRQITIPQKYFEALGSTGEAECILQNNAEEEGYSHTKELFRIKWTDKVDFDLLSKVVVFNIEDKKDMTNFWR